MATKRWIVRIPAGKFMAGMHRFATKREAAYFRNNWQVANGGPRPDLLREERSGAKVPV